MKKLLLVLVVLCTCISCKGQIENKPEASVVDLEYLSDQELQSKSPEQLRLLRNEVYARKGYVFKSDDLNQYFKSKSWYTPNPNLEMSLSDKEQSYVNKIKNIENLSIKNKICISFYDDRIKTIYPIKGNNGNWPPVQFFKSYNEKNKRRLYSITLKKGLFCDGFYAYNIDCNQDVENILFTAYCNDDPIYHVISIKDNKVIKTVKIVGSSLGGGSDSIAGGYHDIDFKLDHDNLEVYKIFKIWDKENSTQENRYPTKEIRREVTKYKLTNQGLVER